METTHYVDKTNNTFTDVLVAYGLAKIFSEALRQTLGDHERIEVWLRDAGPYYEVETSHPMPEQCDFFEPMPFIKSQKAIPPPEVGPVRDYEAEWNRVRAYAQARSDWREAIKNNVEANSDIQHILADPPPADFSVVALLGDYRMQAQGIYNTAMAQWAQTRDVFAFNFKTFQEMFVQSPNDIEGATKRWKKQVKISGIKVNLTASQLFNPHQGKGQNRTKADGLSMSNTDSFWLLEFLKAVGLWVCAAPRKVRNGDDRKTYILAPMNITLARHEEVFQTFSKRFDNEPNIRMDCVAALRYADAWLEHQEASQQKRRQKLNGVVSGFHVGQYKLLSRNAYTTMNLAFLGIPAWVEAVDDKSIIQAYREIIGEHLTLLSNLDEDKRSEEASVLLHYREFISGGDWNAFFEFCAKNASNAMSLLNHRDPRERKRAKVPTLSNLGRLFAMTQDKPYYKIFQNEGFQNLAAAIRHSTFLPQWNKAKNRDIAYEPEYGLGDTLRRSARFKSKFLAELGSFIHRYEAETLRRMARPRLEAHKGQPKRPTVSEKDLADVAKLIDEYGSEVICNMLVACGYSWAERREAQEEQTTDINPETN